MLKSSTITLNKILLAFIMPSFLACGGMNGHSDDHYASSDGNFVSKIEVTHENGYTQLPSGNDDLFYYQAVSTNWPNFDRQESLTAFEQTLYPHLFNSGCAACHSTDTEGQAPLHSDSDVELAHEYALTKINFHNPEQSRFVERLKIDRHNCPYPSCPQTADEMLLAIERWLEKIGHMLPSAPRHIDANRTLLDNEIVQWISEDKSRLKESDLPYVVYASLHELHNESLSAAELNLVRAALSKALNSTARWAPILVNPKDVTGQGILYRFDIRDYWGYNQGVEKLLFGGGDNDIELLLGNRLNYQGKPIPGDIMETKYNFSGETEIDHEHALKTWQRVLHGNAEAIVNQNPSPPHIEGFKGQRSENALGEYVEKENLEWVEAAQLVYTLTRPDVYNAIMMNPMEAYELEQNLKVDESEGVDSYEYALMFDEITVDSRLLYRANRDGNNWYYKTWDVFTEVFDDVGTNNIFEIYSEPSGEFIRFPFWANPIPKYIHPYEPSGNPTNYSLIATLAVASSFPVETNPNTEGCDFFPEVSNDLGLCRHYTGTGGRQQSASEVIYNLPNGLQGYYLAGGYNQRRVIAANNIVRDPRVIPNAKDDLAYQTGFYYPNGLADPSSRPLLITGSSCIGCHADGMNRFGNDLRDWLDNSPARLPKGRYGVTPWIDDPEVNSRVRELYPPNLTWKQTVERDRKGFLKAMGEIKDGMILGVDKNLYVEPVIWTVEYVQREKYHYPSTQNN